MMWPLLGSNLIDNIPVDVQQEKVREVLNVVSHNPWYDFYTELSRLPPDIQRRTLNDLRLKFQEWRHHQGSV